MNFKIIPLLLVFLTIFLVGSVSAVECNADLSQGGDSCTVSSSLTLNGLPISYNGTMVISASNLILDGNSSIVTGNFTSAVNLISFQTASRINTTIKNFIINNFNYAIGVGSNNNSIFNNTIINVTGRGIFLGNSVYGNNISFNNVTCGGAGGTGLWVYSASYNNILNSNHVSYCRYNINIDLNSYSNNVTNNNLWNYSGSSPYGIWIQRNSTLNLVQNNLINHTNVGIYVTSNNNSVIGNTVYSDAFSGHTTDFSNTIGQIIKDNYLQHPPSIYNDNIHANNVSYFLIQNNTLVHTQYQLQFLGTFSSILNNTMKNSDEGSSIAGSNLLIEGNTFLNTSTNEDNYDVGLKVYNLRDSIISNNNFSGMTSAGLIYMNSSNLSIHNNVFTWIPFSQRYLYSADDKTDPPCAIRSVPLYKSFIGGGNEIDDNDNLTYFSQFYSSNVSVYDNIYDINTQCYLWDIGKSVVFQNITGVWFKSIQVPTYLQGIQDFYISNNFNNLSRYGNMSDNILRYYDNAISFNYNGKGKIKLNGSITKEYMYFLMINDTNGNQLSFNDLTSALVYNTNGSIQCGGLVTGECNITLAPNNASYVLDNFNLTEGVTRDNSPLSFTSSSYTSKHIANSLVETVNTTVSFIVRSCDAGTISYKSNTGLYSRDYQPGEYSCDNYYVTILNVPIEPATNSNEFTIAYNQAAIDSCSGAIDSFGSLTGFFAIFIIVVVAGGLLLLLSGNADSLGDSGTLAMVLVIVAIVLVLGGIIIVNIAGGTC